MKPIQLTEYGKKHWLVEMPGPCLGGGRNVARTEGQSGTILIFDSKELAEEWIKANPEWIKRKPTYVTPGTVKEEAPVGDDWEEISVKKLAPIIAESTDKAKLKDTADNDDRSTARKAAQRRLDELESSPGDA